MPIVVSSDLLITSSVAAMRYLSQATFKGVIELATESGTQTLQVSNPIIVFTPGGCVRYGIGCWYAGGIVDIPQDGIITAVDFEARTMFGDLIAKFRITNMRIDTLAGIYRVDVYATAEIPDKGAVLIRA